MTANRARIDHEAASASVESCSSQWRTSVGRSKQDLTPNVATHRNAIPSAPGMISNTPRSVLRRRNGATAGEGRSHQFAHGSVVNGCLISTKLARQQFDRERLSSVLILAAAPHHAPFSGASRYSASE